MFLLLNRTTDGEPILIDPDKFDVIFPDYRWCENGDEHTSFGMYDKSTGKMTVRVDILQDMGEITALLNRAKKVS